MFGKWKLEKWENPTMKAFLYFEKQNFSAPRKLANTGKQEILIFLQKCFSPFLAFRDD